MSLEPHRTNFNIRRAGVVFLNKQKFLSPLPQRLSGSVLFLPDLDPLHCNLEIRTCENNS
jgi:hypothetical protein